MPSINLKVPHRLVVRRTPVSTNKMTETFRAGDRVKIYLDSKFWKSEGWFAGTIVRIDPYSKHRQFYWVELDLEVEALQGGKTNLVSVFNPRNLKKI
jgi:hypothetical protein